MKQHAGWAGFICPTSIRCKGCWAPLRSTQPTKLSSFDAMFEKYFDDWEVKSEFAKEFVSVFDGWLGAENYHRLDEVTEKDWQKFNTLIARIFENYVIQIVDCESKTCLAVTDINLLLPTYAEAMGKDSSRFTKLVIPELDCVLEEHWDFTYVLWHKNNGAVEALRPFISDAGLYSFHD